MPAKRTVFTTCLICDGRVRTAKSKYCKMDCYRIAQKAKTLSIYEKWILGDTSVVTVSNGELAVGAREFLKKEANWTCVECGWSKIRPSDGTIPVEVDHIDGDPYNNVKTNLRVLCPSCHSLTDTYANKNKGRGRRHRRKSPLRST